MNEITSNETSKKRPGNRKNSITNQTWTSLKASLSEAPLTTDQKIEQLIDNQANLTDQVHNVTLWLNQLIELSKMMMKSQIENVSTINDLKQYLKQSINTLDNKVEWIKDPLIKEISQQSSKIVTAQEAINKKIIDRQSVFAGALISMIKGLKSHDVIDYNCKQSAMDKLTRI